jgi:hypothetical protein
MFEKMKAMQAEKKAREQLEIEYARRKKKELNDWDELVLPKGEEILNGADPWSIEPISYKGKLWYSIVVYDFNDGKWYALWSCSQDILGVNKDEFQRVLQEHYHATLIHDYPRDEYCFETRERAEEVLNEVRSYYHSFHLPRAMMNRLSYYSEGGFPPYFEKYITEDYREQCNKQLEGESNDSGVQN